jgi:hypothetical protein
MKKFNFKFVKTMQNNKNTHQAILSFLYGRLRTNVLSRQYLKNHSVELSGKSPAVKQGLES